MITRYLEHFTQDEVDKAPGDILTKDLPYGGNRPYVVGTILRNSTNGEYITWRKGTETHRLCIEHSSNELVEWTLATETMSSAFIDLQQLTRDYPFGKIKRIGMIPLDAAPSGAPSTYYDRAYCASTSSSSPNTNYKPHWFMLGQEQCELKLTQVTPLMQPTYCELDALFYAPYFTDKVYFTDLSFALSPRGVVFYCVYELYDGLLEFPQSDIRNSNSSMDVVNFPILKIPFTSGYCNYICFDSFLPNTSISAQLALHKFDYVPGADFSTDTVWQKSISSNPQGAVYNVSRENIHFTYGSFFLPKIVTSVNNPRGWHFWLRFTSDKFNS